MVLALPTELHMVVGDLQLGVLAYLLMLSVVHVAVDVLVAMCVVADVGVQL